MVLINKFKKWVSKKIATISLAIGNVEKNTLGQNGEQLTSDANQVRRNTQGQLADSLVHGEVTQEVMDLRWRIYKVLKEAEGVTAEFVGYDEDGMPIIKTKKVDKKKILKKVKVDTHDNYPLEIVFDNTEIAIGSNDVMNNDNITIFDSIIENYNDNGELISVTHGSIDSVEYFATNKSEVPLKIVRPYIPKFKLENYTKKMNVRKINEQQRLLEFYVSKYPDEYNRTSRLFISEIKKIINGESTTTIEISSVNFISYKTIGSDDFLMYDYTNVMFDKIIEFDGYYVIKFISDVSMNGVDILEKHRVSELDKKYEQKLKKK